MTARDPDGGGAAFTVGRKMVRSAAVPMPIVRQAGAVVYRDEDGIVRVLLVRAKNDPALWVFPKGHIEPGESPGIAALRETFEETGATGLVIGRAGPTVTFRSGDELVAVDYVLVQLTAEMPSPEGREKTWLLPEEAEERLVFDNARQLMKTALHRIAVWQDGRIPEGKEGRK